VLQLLAWRLYDRLVDGRSLNLDAHTVSTIHWLVCPLIMTFGTNGLQHTLRDKYILHSPVKLLVAGCWQMLAHISRSSGRGCLLHCHCVAFLFPPSFQVLLCCVVWVLLPARFCNFAPLYCQIVDHCTTALFERLRVCTGSRWWLSLLYVMMDYSILTGKQLLFCCCWGAAAAAAAVAAAAALHDPSST